MKAPSSYRFTATLTKPPFTQTMKGKVKVIGTALDALHVIREIIRQDEMIMKDGTSLKISISPARNKF